MTYRDERLILREKLGELETEAARLTGRVSGLQRAVYEAHDRREQAQAQLGRVPLRRRFKKVVALLLGLAGVAGGCGLCALGGMALQACDSIHRSLSADTDGSASGVCRIVVDEVESQVCKATVQCQGQRRYEGTGACREVGDALEYWDDDDGSDGTPALVVSETERAAAVRDGDVVLRMQLDIP